MTTPDSSDVPAGGYLLDANVLIALVVVEHEHHEIVRRWFTEVDRTWLCSLVEGSLIRFLLRIGESATVAQAVLTMLADEPKVEFLTISPSYRDVDLGGIRGHRQVTDVYLAGLAASHGLRLATLDRALAELRPVHTSLIQGRP
ncbi:MAG: PIN domain-containing protein [Actinobacteria bacterium]|nr:PIN domain-containing protein [Actinomycetota bacterium]